MGGGLVHKLKLFATPLVYRSRWEPKQEAKIGRLLRTRPGSIDNLLGKANALCQLAESLPDRLSSYSQQAEVDAAMALNAKTDPNYVPKRINGKFAPGYSGNPGGSLEATRRSFNKDLLLALAADFKRVGTL